MKINIRNTILSICWGVMSSVMGYSVKTVQGAIVFSLGMIIILILADKND
jgi:hypothetical protein